MTRGRFIVLEGLDGAGTTTQAARLVDALTAAGRPTLRTAEPTTGPVGRLIRTSLAAAPESPAVESLPWLFAADRADHLQRLVEPALAEGRWVVSDRYAPSSLAYQSLTLPLRSVWALNHTFRAPDALLFVRVAPEVALERIERRGAAREIYERRDRLVAIADAYERVLALLADEGWPVTMIDGEQPIEAVWHDIWRATQALGA